MISFFVPGLPATAGSKRAFVVRGRPIVTDTSGQKGKNWRAVVQLAARAAHYGPPLQGPLELGVKFFLPRPKAHYGTKGVRRTAPQFPTVKPDATKLLRAVEDACTGILWHDDAQVVSQRIWKLYVSGTKRPGVDGIGAQIELSTLLTESP